MDETAAAASVEEPKKTNKERLKEITDSIEAGIKDLFDSEKYKNYLRTMSKFHNYSFNNTMLIHMQNPEATRVASFNSWRDKFHRNVKRGEHGIKIIAPTPYIKKIEEMKRDPETNAPMVDANGEVIMEEKQIKIPRFKVVTVFDVSQTYGEPLPQLASDLTGDVQQFDIFMEALKRSAPVPLEVQPLASNLDGYFSPTEQKIAIREGMSEVQTICAAVHEITHSILHNKEEKAEEKKSQRTQEVEAESVAFSVCAYYGIETGENSFGYLASWSSGQDLKELKASLETINRTAGKLINDIDKNFDLICKERGIDRSEKRVEPRAHEALFLLDDNTYFHVQRRSDGIDYDFSFYDAATLKLMDGGVTELPEDSTLIDAPLIVVADEILKDNSIHCTAMMPVDLSKLHEIEAVNEVAPAVEVAAEPEPVQDVGKLDEYPMPDPFVDPKQFEKAGVTDDELLPVSRSRAYEFIGEDFSVYSVVAGDVALCMDADEIEDSSDAAMFGIDRNEWEESARFRDAIEDRLAHQPEREEGFLSHPESFAIYQMDHDLDSIPLRFSSYDELAAKDMTPTRDMYDLIYTAELNGKSLDDIFYEFNEARPVDYKSYSLSASDIIALNQGGAVTYYYVDRFGFKELPDFAKDNPLKNAEMSVEDDYNMVDGIINNGEKLPSVAELEERSKHEPISLMDLNDAIRREQKTPEKKPEVMEKRPSVLAMLKQPVPTQDGHKKTAPSRGAEMEI